MSTQTANIELTLDITADAEEILNTDATDWQKMERWQEHIKPLWEAAFWPHPPLVELKRDYNPGGIVWMYDHYNTAVIMGQVRSFDDDGSNIYTVRTVDSDGSVHEYDYNIKQLRPADEPHVFVYRQPSICPMPAEV